MTYVGFSDSGYECLDAGHYLLFAENNSHELLFHYVAQDLSCLPELFDQFISRRMDTTTFALHNCPCDDTIINQMEDALAAAHPYYKHEAKSVLARAIGDYFNKLLLYSCYHRRIAIPDSSEVWYIERITNLLEPWLELGDTYPKDFCYEYQKQISEGTYTADLPSAEIEVLISDIPPKMPTGFSNEIRTQREIYNMLYFLLDISADGLDELTTPQRIQRYSNIMADSGAGLTIPRQLSSKHLTIYRGHNGVPADICSAIDCAKAAETTELYEISNLHQLLCLEVWSMVQDEVKIQKCRRCNKYFVVPNRRYAYCNRVGEDGLRCRDVGSDEAFQKKMENDEPLKIYRRAYKTHKARVKNEIMSEDNFKLWRDKAKSKLAEVRAGKLDIACFQEWLKK